MDILQAADIALLITGIKAMSQDYDSIEFYSDETIQEWLQQFLNDEQERIILPGIPFSYYEVARESIRREYQKNPQ